MAGFVPVIVEAYAGYKADESPRAFLWEGRRFEVEEVVDRWYQASRDPALGCADYFKVRAAGGLFILRHDHERQEWFLQGP